MAASSNILIVDDDPDICQVLKILLSETYTVAEASSGMEAVAYVKEHPELDLVLLDVMMQGMDGFQTCDAIRKDSRPVPHREVCRERPRQCLFQRRRRLPVQALLQRGAAGKGQLAAAPV